MLKNLCRSVENNLKATITVDRGLARVGEFQTSALALPLDSILILRTPLNPSELNPKEQNYTVLGLPGKLNEM